MCCGGGLRSDRHGDFQLLPFHCSLYFFVCSKNIFIGIMRSFHFILSYLGANPHHFFPTLPRVGHDAFAAVRSVLPFLAVRFFSRSAAREL